MQRLTSDRPLLLILTILTTIGILGTIGAGNMHGRAFPGFLVLGNGVVASATVPGWSATEGGEIYQHEVIAIGGESVAGTGGVYRVVREHPIGTPLVYRFRNLVDGREFERRIETQPFAPRDSLLLFGVYLLNGIALSIAALMIRLRNGGEAARSTLPFFVVGALWGLSAMDLYSPYRLFRFHAACETLLAPAILQMALGFPRPLVSESLRRILVRAGYIVAICLGISYQLGLFTPTLYVESHLIAISLAGLALAFFLGSQLWRFFAARWNRELGSNPAMLTLSVAALGLPIILSAGEFMTGGQLPQSAVGFSVFIFPLAVTWGLRRRLARTT